MTPSKSTSRAYSKAKTQVEQLFELLLDVQAKTAKQLSDITRALGELQNYSDERHNILRNDMLLLRTDIQATNNILESLKGAIDEARKAAKETEATVNSCTQTISQAAAGPREFWKDKQWWMVITIVMLVILLGLTWGFDLPSKVNELRVGKKIENVYPTRP